MEIGGSPAKGAVALRVAPKTRELRHRFGGKPAQPGSAWLPVLLGAGTTIAGTRPAGWGLSSSAEAALLAGGTLEHVKAVPSTLSGTELIVVREANAFLPGNGKLRSERTPSRRTIRHGCSSRAMRDLDAPLLRTTMRWLDQAVPGWLPRRLLAGLPEAVAQRAKLSAHVVANGNDVALQHLNGTLDDAAISGGVRLKRAGPAQPHGRSVGRPAGARTLAAPRPASLAELHAGSVRS